MTYRSTEIRSAMDALGSTELLAIVIHKTVDLEGAGVHFHTPAGVSQQVATMFRRAGTEVKPHRHRTIMRQVRWTQEVLIVVHGEMAVTLWNPDDSFSQKVILSGGDIICLMGAHGIEFITDTELIEVKQGPYSGQGDDKEFLHSDKTKELDDLRKAMEAGSIESHPKEALYAVCPGCGSAICTTPKECARRING